jgi:CO/xanthine dehydrogenase Mo-binding subunit
MTEKWIGESARRVGGYERVAGLQRFAADIVVSDTLHMKLVSLDCGHARIIEVDSSDADQVDGVVRVFTAADFGDPAPRFGPRFRDRPVIATGETKFHGEPVAAVVAVSVDAADEAAALVRVEHEELPGVYTVAAALDPNAPLVDDPILRTHDDPLWDSNIRQEWHYGWGDVDGAKADFVVENVYEFPMVTHFAIEPHVFMAAPERDGVIVWSSIQHPYLLQRTLSELLEMPISKVHVIAPDPGGGFGGKGYPKFEPLVAMAALQLKQPVRLVLTLDETFQAVRRTSARIQMRTGFNNDGSIVFVDSVDDFLMGAYADIAPRVISKSAFLATGPYRVPASRVIARAITSHTPPSTAFRGFGTPQVSWAIESQVDEAARILGMDRVAIRLLNLGERGEVIVPGDTPVDGEWRESVEMAAAAIDWGSPLPDGRGRGLSVGVKASATMGASYCIVRLLYDGSVLLMAGTSDMGQGARTVLTQIVSQELGVPPEKVNVVMGDTAVVPFDLSTSASRSTVFMGRAVLKACSDIRGQLLRMAAEAFGVAEAEVSIDGETVDLPGRKMGTAALLEEVLGPVRGEVIGTGSQRGEADPDHPLGGPTAFYEFSCTASEVEVDRETGEMLLIQHVTVADIGKALNPQHVEMQDEGAAIMGLGHTMMEHILLDDSGRIRNLGALDYRIPTFKDVPVSMRSMVVENEDGPGPYGAKGTGEGGLLATSSAVASAVTDAVGVVIRSLPLTPERIWRALEEQRSTDVREAAAIPWKSKETR